MGVLLDGDEVVDNVHDHAWELVVMENQGDQRF